MLYLLLVSFISLILGDPSATCPNGVVPGSLTWTNAGKSTTGYLIQAGGSNSWGPVSSSGSQVTFGNGPRFYLANACVSAFGSSVFQKINPLGATISFTVNLNTVGCGVDAAFYLVGMPAGSAEGNGDYYCDANCVEGCCAEMDLLEANRHALQITAHKCTSPTGGCDAGGCALNTKSISNGYGPSSSYKINTSSAFNVKITFGTSGGALSTITSVISQGSNSITLTHSSSNCGSGYLSGMDSAFNAGMVPVWSMWSGSMSWLDSPACSSDTNEMSGTQMIFSNFAVSGSGAVAPPPPPPPPGSQVCGSSSGTNAYYVEFFPPSGSSNPVASGSATVICDSGTSSVFTIQCTWFSAGSKYQCSPGSKQCSSPIPQYNGKACPFSSGALVDESAQMTNSLGTGPIVGIAVGCIVAIVVLVVVIVIVVKKQKQIEEYA